MSSTPTPTIRYSAQQREAGSFEDLRQEQWALDRLMVPVGSENLPWPSGEGSIVAVMDTGIDTTHGELAHAVVGRWGQSMEPLDPLGHGTEVAGVISARSLNGGTAGIAPHAQLLDVPVEVTDHNQRLYNAGRKWTSGLLWATNQGAHVANLSFGATQDTVEKAKTDDIAVLVAVVSYAVENNVSVVAAAGNCGPTSGRSVAAITRWRYQRRSMT